MPDVVTRDGCRLASWLAGPPGAPVLVLASSLGTDHTMWEAQATVFADHVRVLRYDARGHGASDAPAGAYSLERLAEDVLDLLDAHGVARAHFCGLSLGGMIGQWLAAHAPERIDRLILANTAACMGPPAFWDQRIEVVRTQGTTAIADGVVARWFTPAFREREPREVARFHGLLLATSAVGYAGCCAAIRDMDQRATAAQISAPTLLIAGSEDPSTPPALSEELARAIPGAQLTTLASAHLSSAEQPAAFNRAVLEHLA
ncbi:MAG: 3-oxoadipate enol-lactonase [Myxococcota bacterium]|nr:3-oxoadipate enol-lactonase [Myxococcota bacterium]